MQAKGGGLAFIQGHQPAKPSQVLLVYINRDHEYVVFDPHSNEADELSLTRRELAAVEETGGDS